MDEIISLRVGRDLRQSVEFSRFMESIGWKIQKIGGGQVFIKQIGPLKMAKMRRPGPRISWPEVLGFVKKEKIVIFQIDPEVDDPKEFNKIGFRKNGSQLLGTKTLLLDLRPEEKAILAGLKQETRYKLNKLSGGKFDMELNNFDKFYEILRLGYKEIDVWCPPKFQYDTLIKSFGDKAFCLTINGVSGCLILIHEGVAEYYYAASTAAGKENNLPYLVVWEAMKEAKKRGAVVWDFNGLYDERYPDKRWKGFSFFKSRFGGAELEFAGTYTKFGWN